MSAPFVATVHLEGKPVLAAGYPPFLMQAAGGGYWMVTGRDGDNCLAFPRDGLRAIFVGQEPARLLCQELNLRASR
jgi:hypothetical protein